VVLALLSLLAAPLPAPVVLYAADGSGWGQACVVGVDEALTAGHVVDAVPADKLRWREALGQREGQVTVISREKDRDLARVRLEGAGGLLPIGRTSTRTPEPGEDLRISGVAGPRRRPVVIHGRFLWTDDAGDLMIDALTFGGLSGACVIDAEGRVLGVIGGAQTNSSEPWRRSIAYAIRVKR